MASLLSTAPSAIAAAGTLTATQLTTNSRIDPLGIPGDAPTLGWVNTAPGRDAAQTAYEVRVGSTPTGDDVWATGKVASADQVNVVYRGPALTSATRYYWQVRTWDGADRVGEWSDVAWFETGLLDVSDWAGADWITAADPSREQWADYTASFDFSIRSGGFSPYFRAADISNALMWQLSVADGTPHFRPHRKLNGAFTVLQDVDLSSKFSAAELLAGTHNMTITVSSGPGADVTTVSTMLDGVPIDSRQVPSTAAISTGVVGFRAGDYKVTAEKYTVQHVAVTAANGGAALLDTDFSRENPFDGGTVVDGALQIDGPGAEVLLKAPARSLPLLRTEFTTTPGKTIASARAYASARGVYELRLNGDAVDDRKVAPEYTDYRKQIYDQTYDVTDQLRDGANALGVQIADGWWAGKVGYMGSHAFGWVLSTVVQLRIRYTDGTTQVVGSGNGWTTHEGPYAAADLIDGETYDARLEQPGWDLPGFDATGWEAAEVVDSATALLAPQPDGPVLPIMELPAVKRTEPEPGVYLFDVGQNMTGVARIRLQGVAGQTVRIRYGEEVYRTGADKGKIYRANLRGAKVTDYYTFKTTGTVVYEPKFTFHGFRYLDVTGVSAPPELSDVTAIQWTSEMRDTGTFETSDPDLNQLQSNLSWARRSNYLSIATPENVRDERLGWTGDNNLFTPTASYNADTRAFLRKWLHDLVRDQLPNGDVPSVAPETWVGRFPGAVGWSDALITVVHALYRDFDDQQTVRETYDAMKKFMAYVRSQTTSDLVGTRGGYLDWLNLDDPTPAPVISTAYLAEDARMLGEMAAAIGDTAYAAQMAQLSDDARAAFTNNLVSADGTVSGNSQTGYAMALAMHLVPDEMRSAVADRLVEKIEASGNHLTTGFLGAQMLLPALSGSGHADEAYALMMRKEIPSWLYPVTMGATAIWERWDTIRPDGSFGNDSMNAFNLYAYGSVGQWMYENIGGLQPLEPGYRKSLVAPLVGGGLTHAAGTLETVYGTLSSSWTKTSDRFTLDVTVPVSTTAEVRIPTGSLLQVTESGRPVAEAQGVHDVRLDGDTAVVTVGSGSYSFEAQAALAPLTDVVDAVTGVRNHIDELVQSEELSAAVADQMNARLDAISGPATEAITAQLGGDRAQVSGLLSQALEAAIAARSWFVSAGVPEPAASDLVARLQNLQVLLGNALAWSHDVSLTLVPGGSALPGQTVTGTIQVASAGQAEVSDISAAVKIDRWSVDSSQATLAGVGSGHSGQLAFSAVVPRNAPPGPVEAEVTATLTIDGKHVTMGARAAWLTVDPTLSITQITTANDAGTAPVAVKVTVANTGASDARGQVFLSTPSGWRASPPSGRIIVPAGRSASATVTAFVPSTVVEGSYPVVATFRDAGATYASGTGSIPVALAAPATGGLDHVDFGESTSETAHAVQAAPHSGTSTEAGFTRRYAHSSYPGSWFSAEVSVPRGKPFEGVIRETFDGARTKKYNVYVDDVLQTQLLVPRAESGTGTLLHRFVVDSPQALSDDGKVRIKFEYPTTGAGFYDPSIADLWIVPYGDDAVPPAVGVVPTSMQPGDDGWDRGAVTLTASAADDRDTDPLIQRRAGDGWVTWDGPLTISDEGLTEVEYRARDTTGNTSLPSTATVRIDSTPPATTITLGTQSGGARAVAFSATDALSGIAATFARIDGGRWAAVDRHGLTIEEPGTHSLEYYSVDVAGNVENLRTVSVDVARTGAPAVVRAVVSAVAPVVRYHQRARVDVSVSAPGRVASGGVQVFERGVVVGRGVLSGGRATVTLAASLRRTLTVGRHTLQVVYVPGPGSGVSAPGPVPVTVRVTKGVAKVKVVKAKDLRRGARATVWVRVKPLGVYKPKKGKVTVKVGKATVGKAKVKKAGKRWLAKVRSRALPRKGKVVVTFKAKKLAKQKITTRYKVR